MIEIATPIIDVLDLVCHPRSPHSRDGIQDTELLEPFQLVLARGDTPFFAEGDEVPNGEHRTDRETIMFYEVPQTILRLNHAFPIVAPSAFSVALGSISVASPFASRKTRWAQRVKSARFVADAMRRGLLCEEIVQSLGFQ